MSDTESEWYPSDDEEIVIVNRIPTDQEERDWRGELDMIYESTLVSENGMTHEEASQMRPWSFRFNYYFYCRDLVWERNVRVNTAILNSAIRPNIIND